MKRLLTFFAITGFAAVAAFGQGSLSPASAPVATMKTLEQIEPRRAIKSLPFTILNPGNYYLTTNVTGTSGISITADDVTLDLNGFTITGQPGVPGAGINLGSFQRTTLRNGTVQNWPGDGITASGSQRGARVIDVNAVGNAGAGFALRFENHLEGCLAQNNQTGFDVEGNNTILNSKAVGNTNAAFVVSEGCILTRVHGVANGGAGVDSQGTGQIQVRESKFSSNSGAAGINLSGIDNMVQDCTVEGTAGHGIYLGDKSVVLNCTVNFALSNGVDVGESSQVIDTRVGFAQVNGFHLQSYCQVKGCSAVSSGGYGFRVEATGVSGINIENSTASENGSGGFYLVPSVRNELIGVHSINNSGSGIIVGDASLVKDCVSSLNQGLGFHVGASSRIIDSISSTNTSIGFSGFDEVYFSGCSAIGNEDEGFGVIDHCRFENCYAAFNAKDGFSLEDAPDVQNCSAMNNGSNGFLVVGNKGSLENNTAKDNLYSGFEIHSNFGGTTLRGNDAQGHTTVFESSGIILVGKYNQVDNNYLARNQINIAVVGTNNVITRNVFSRPIFLNSAIDSSNAVAPVIDISSGFSGGFNENHPWANFEN